MDLLADLFSKELLAQFEGKGDGRSGAFGGGDLARNRDGIVDGLGEFFPELRRRVAGGSLPDQSLVRQNHRRGRADGGVEFPVLLLLFEESRKDLGIPEMART